MKEWHARAKEMRAAGLTLKEIGAAVGRSHSTVHWAIDARNAREETRKRVRRNRAIARGNA